MSEPAGGHGESFRALKHHWHRTSAEGAAQAEFRAVSPEGRREPRNGGMSEFQICEDNGLEGRGALVKLTVEGGRESCSFDAEAQRREVA